MKYIYLFLSCWIGFSACSKQEELMHEVGNGNQAVQSPYKVNVKLPFESNLRFESCLITGTTESRTTQSIRVEGSQLLFNNEQVATLLETTELGKPLSCLFELTRNGEKQTYSATINDQLQGRMAYTWELTDAAGEISAKLSITPWQEGGTIITGPDDFAYQLDLENSKLPEFVHLSATADTLFVPSCKTELLLALDADVETVWMSQGAPLQMEQVTGLDYLGNRFRLSFEGKGLLAERSVTRIFFGEKGEDTFDEKPLVIVQETPRLELLSNEVTIYGNEVNYADYIDGTLATVKAGHSVASYTINSDSQAQYEWIVMQRRNGRFYVEGGFKPNDVEAMGQRQASTITIEYTDGVEEHYTFSRLRHALPVVKFGEHYWSKFNMRGNSKGYEEQIGFDLDRPDMWSYLKNCDGNAFIAYAGSQYCGTNPEGLDMVKNSVGGFSYQGYPQEFGSTTINDIQIDSHCPAGYQVPTEEEMKTIIGGSVVSLVGLSTMQEYQNAYLVNRERYTVDRHRRGNIVKSGITIPNVYHLKITNLQGEELVMHGVGYQSEANAINYGYWLYAAVSNGKDQAGFNNNRNNFYMQGHSGQKTVSVRCIKTPVNYIIE